MTIGPWDIKPPTAQPKHIRLSAMADTGCQSCLASLKVIHRLGLPEDDLLPVTMRMNAANNHGFQILNNLEHPSSGIQN